MRVFVAGATGVIGRRVIPLLAAGGNEVTAIGRSPEKRARLEGMGARGVDVNLFDVADLRRAVNGHDVVINLATHLPPMLRMLMPGAWSENDRIRRFASANVAQVASEVGVQRLIQESFALVYPDRGDLWIDETTPIQPVRYNRTVADAEHAAEGFTSRGGTGIVLRFAAFYGSDSEQVPAILASIRRGWVPIPGSPNAYFPSVSHDDAAAAVVAALGVNAGVYNVVDDQPLRRREYFDSIAELLGVPPPRILPSWVGRVIGSLGEMFARSIRMSNQKLKTASGWAPRYPSAREGWRATIEEMRTGRPSAEEPLRKAG